MYLTDEDKIQYNLIEDEENNAILGAVGDIIDYLKDMIKYNLDNTDDAENIKQINDVIENIECALDEDLSLTSIICIYENIMCGIDWYKR